MVCTMIEINWVKNKVIKDEYVYSRHGDKERQNDNLSMIEVDEAILNGRILDNYEDTEEVKVA